MWFIWLLLVFGCATKGNKWANRTIDCIYLKALLAVGLWMLSSQVSGYRCSHFLERLRGRTAGKAMLFSHCQWMLLHTSRGSMIKGQGNESPTRTSKMFKKPCWCNCLHPDSVSLPVEKRKVHLEIFNHVEFTFQSTGVSITVSRVQFGIRNSVLQLCILRPKPISNRSLFVT